MTVSEQIIQVLDALGERIGIAVDWTSQNVMPVAQQICERYIRYEIIMSILWIIFNAAIIVGLVFGGIKLFKFLIKAKQESSYQRNYYVWTDVLMPIAGIIIGILGICSICDIVANIETLCKCLLLPELHLFEELSGLLK